MQRFEDICFPLWDNTTLVNDPSVRREDRVAIAIHNNNLMNPVLKVRKSTIPNISPARPWGIFADEDIVSRVVILEYKGEIIWDRSDSSRDDRYVFDNRNGSFTDGYNPLIAGIARFINSTGEGEEECANCEVRCRNGKLYVDSIKYIHKGSELLYDYGKAYEWEGEQKSCYTRLVTRRKPKKG
jgi:SET domain-containing protein